MNVRIPMYELSVACRVTWQAHALSNSGSEGSNHTWGRRQRLATGEEVDSISGRLTNRCHAVILAEYFEQMGVPLCEACQRRDGRRAAALVKTPTGMGQILTQCGLCDAHGFLRLPKSGSNDDTELGQRQEKHGLFDFPAILALPDQWQESSQQYSRQGRTKNDGQMVYSFSVRSGTYSVLARYHAIGVGMDTNRWQLWVRDPGERLQRHIGILLAFRDQLVSPSGAQTLSLLPHLTDLNGIIVVKRTAGRVPVLSAMENTYVEQTRSIVELDESLTAFTFETAAEFYRHLTYLAETTEPAQLHHKPIGKSGLQAQRLKSGRRSKGRTS